MSTESATARSAAAPEAKQEHSAGHGHSADHDHVEDPRTTAILRRLKSVEGHVRGVERMVAEGVYCMDVMNQILAVQRALKKVGGLVLERHLETCVTTAIRSEDSRERERVIDEIMDVFEATGKA